MARKQIDSGLSGNHALGDSVRVPLERIARRAVPAGEMNSTAFAGRRARLRAQPAVATDPALQTRRSHPWCTPRPRDGHMLRWPRRRRTPSPAASDRATPRSRRGAGRVAAIRSYLAWPPRRHRPAREAGQRPHPAATAPASACPATAARPQTCPDHSTHLQDATLAPALGDRTEPRCHAQCIEMSLPS